MCLRVRTLPDRNGGQCRRIVCSCGRAARADDMRGGSGSRRIALRGDDADARLCPPAGVLSRPSSLVGNVEPEQSNRTRDREHSPVRPHSPTPEQRASPCPRVESSSTSDVCARGGGRRLVRRRTRVDPRRARLTLATARVRLAPTGVVLSRRGGTRKASQAPICREDDVGVQDVPCRGNECVGQPHRPTPRSQPGREHGDLLVEGDDGKAETRDRLPDVLHDAAPATVRRAPPRGPKPESRRSSRAAAESCNRSSVIRIRRVEHRDDDPGVEDD